MSASCAAAVVAVMPAQHREEITDAVRTLLKAYARSGLSLREDIEQISPKAIGQTIHLVGAPEPDLLIRTSGEARPSGFHLWQSPYSEFYVSDALWPQLRKVDSLRAVSAFQHCQRRFGH